MPVHSHTVNDPKHSHAPLSPPGGQFYTLSASSPNAYYSGSAASLIAGVANTTALAATGITIANAGSGGSHSHPISNGVLYCDFIIAQKN
jgi:microcystin-dependent protein